ncbi:MAG: FAD-dependent oxidoreductase [Bacteroidales bacterium]|nr:FAD-dependent oxidoreductase [Bacteroidales bacterium]
MHEELNLVVPPAVAISHNDIKQFVARKTGHNENEITHIIIRKKSVDARNQNIKINLSLTVYINEKYFAPQTEVLHLQKVNNKPPVIIVGAGPAGLFAALRIIELGCKPIIIERGKTISERKKDIAAIHRNHQIDPDSNYCFGEGGAGTFSDGKLYTRSKKKGENARILEIFHAHGAQNEILYESHPHIGSDILPRIIKNIRSTILDAGGEFIFGERVIDFYIKNGTIAAINTHKGTRIETKAVILATGHSARDIYELIHSKGLVLEAKPFAAGVRVEHPQDLIDNIQYHRSKQMQYLPPANYNLITQVDERGVYSFCMCPGGYIVPSATSQNEVVVNGMSSSQRNTPFANSGIVVEIKPEDCREFESSGPLALLKYQQHLEKLAWLNGGSGQTAPAQRLHDFITGKLSPNLPPNSYIPGLSSSPMHFWLPESISQRLRKGFQQFGKKMHGFITNEALVAGVESRTSSPIRIPREEETLQHPQIKGLFPAGEGSGYSGGIVSSAIDGMRCAEKAVELLNNLLK